MASNIPLTNDEDLDLRRYLALLRENIWWLVAMTVLASAAAFVFSAFAMTPVYQASTSLLIDKAPGTGSSEITDLQLSERKARTYAELITTQPVLDAVAAKVGVESSSLRDKISATWIDYTQIITINVADEDPEQAAAIANALADEFITYIMAIQASRYAESKTALSIQLDALSQQIAQTEASLASLGDGDGQTAERDRLTAQLSELRSSNTTVMQSYEDVRMAESQTVSNIIQIEPAVPPTKPTSPNILRNTLLAGFLGAMATFGISLIRDTLSTTVETPEDVITRLHIPALGKIPHMTNEQPALITASHPFLPAAEAYRTLRTNIRYSNPENPPRRILITSPVPQDGKTTTAVNLAIAMAQGGQRVILIDGDLRRPDMHRILSLSNEDGLSDLLRQSQQPVENFFQQTSQDNLFALTAGAIPPNPAELLDSPRMADVIGQVSLLFDTIIIDAPPVLAVTDAITLARQVDGVILTVRSKQTEYGACHQALIQLKQVGANILGGVITNLGERHADYYYQGYNYYYSPEEDEGVKKQKKRLRKKQPSDNR